MNHSCEVCKKKIEEPLYWADPKFYDIPKKVFFCDALITIALNHFFMQKTVDPSMVRVFFKLEEKQ